MAEETGIAWTDSTFNAWWGCVKVGPECEHCYAETLDLSTGGLDGGTNIFYGNVVQNFPEGI